MEKKWFELEERERLKVFGQFTIKEWWDWWSNKEPRIMEVRILDYLIIKETATKFNLPYSSSGVYVSNDMLLKAVIGHVRDRASIWFGVNPKKKHWNRFGYKGFSGRDEGISEIGYVFIDIDRLRSTGYAANKNELEKADKLANLILLAFAKEVEEEKSNWTLSYCKLCSGNGVQLLIKLDIFIRLPTLIFDSNTKSFEYNPKFEREKEIIKRGIGQQLLEFTKSVKKKLGVVVDPSVFNIGRVAALPFTKNYKYGGYTWRGIVELEKGVNKGLSNYLLSVFDTAAVVQKRHMIFDSSGVKTENRIKSIADLEQHPLTQLLLHPNLIKGGGHVNNKLWMMLKVLIRDNDLNIRNNEFYILHRKLQKNYGNLLSLNVPDLKITYNTNTVNKYCRKFLFPPLDPLWPNKDVEKKIIGNMTWDMTILPIAKMNAIIFKGIDNPLNACKKFKQEYLKSRDIEENTRELSWFTCGLIKTYGKDIAKYYSTYLYDRFFNFNYSVNNRVKTEE